MTARGRWGPLILLTLLTLNFVSPASAVPTCFGRPATFVGTDERDEFFGKGHKTDVIVSYGAFDFIATGPGKDFICTGPGGDIAMGEGGHDRIKGGRGGDFLDGNAGGDLLRGGGNEDWMNGNAGEDKIVGGAGPDIIDDEDSWAEFPSPEDPTYRDVIHGGRGADSITSIFGANDRAVGGPGKDECTIDRRSKENFCERAVSYVDQWNTRRTKIDGPRCFNDRPTIVGTAGPDRMVGTDGSDVFIGRAGDDDIQGGPVYYGGDESDLICSGGGFDVVSGYGGRDQISGGIGNDTIAGNWDRDIIYGGPGNDESDDFDDAYSSEADTYYMGPGADVVRLESPGDVVFGQAGPDEITDAYCGNSILHGGPGRDFLHAHHPWDDYGGGLCGNGDVGDDVYGDEGRDEAIVTRGDNVYGVELVTTKEPGEEK